MKWFKHDTDASLSEGMDKLVELGGWESYGRWFRVLEIVASKMDESDRCFAEFSVKKWCQMLGFSPKKFQNFTEILQKFCQTSVVFQEKFCRIEIPNLLKKKDEYSKKSGQTPKNIPPKIKSKEVLSKDNTRVKSKEKDIPPFNSPKGEAQTFFENWNLVAEQNGLPTLTKLPNSIKKKIQDRLKEPEFRPPEIFEAIPKLPNFWLGKDNKRYKLTLEYLVRNDKNYLNLISLSKNGNTNGYSKEFQDHIKSAILTSVPNEM